MFDRYLDGRTLKREATTEPFVDDDAEGILVAGRSWVSLNLFRGHVGYRAGDLLCTLETRALHNDSYTEITQQNFVVTPNQHVFGLDVTVDEFFVVGIL